MASPRRPETARNGSNTLLLVDAAVNLILGLLLAIYPQRLVEALGLPAVASTLYPNVLGGVLVGIGIALLMARRGGGHGLGLDGAIAINVCGAGALAGWLALAPEQVSTTGRITLWVVAVLVLGIAAVELVHRRR